MAKWIKNDSGGDKTWVGQLVLNAAYYQIQTHEEVSWANNSALLTDIGSGDAIVAKDDSGTADIVDINEAISYLKDNTPSDVNVTTIPELHAFAAPEFRTKRDKCPTLTTVVINGSEIIDYQLTEEMYASGGKIVVKNAEFGDWVSAEVYDKDSVIPTEYRAATCEAWPSVAKYIISEWVSVNDSTICEHTIDTKPLNAKITAGLYLRVTYNTTNAGISREVLINYDLTKKL